MPATRLTPPTISSSDGPPATNRRGA
jgi:hypothetical protein